MGTVIAIYLVLGLIMLVARLGHVAPKIKSAKDSSTTAGMVSGFARIAIVNIIFWPVQAWKMVQQD